MPPPDAPRWSRHGGDHQGDGRAAAALDGKKDGLAATNAAALRQRAKASLAKNRTSINSLAVITAKTDALITGADTKDVAATATEWARQMLALSWPMLQKVDSADAGSA